MVSTEAQPDEDTAITDCAKIDQVSTGAQPEDIAEDVAVTDKVDQVIDSVEAGVCGSHSASSVLSTFPQFLLWALEVSLICWSLDVFGVGEGFN
ncbi:uncharacterized protein LOC144040259 isoform X2 [Vanacampus margaritifer]